MTVVLAEKPSVARDLAKHLGARTRGDGYLEGNGYQVTWAYGHLVTLKEPQDYDPSLRRWSLEPLPFVPDRFELKVIDSKLAKKQFRTVKHLLRQATDIICATDAGREGELIFRYIQDLSGVAGKPFRRLWLNSLTDRAVREAFAHLRDGREYDRLYAAARCRSEADWIVGLNATRNYTVRFGGRATLWSVGRVQTPVLAMIVRRDDEIRRFKPEAFWELLTNYRGTLFKYTGKRFPVREEANRLLGKVRGHPFEVTGVKTKEETSQPPQLFDLTELQRNMNGRFKLSAAATLKIAQKLYEDKLITYPRTDSRYLTSDMRREIPAVLSDLRSVKPEAIERLDLDHIRFSGRIINDGKVTDHHAIIPTGRVPAGLTGTAAQVFDAVVTRFIAAFYPPCKKLRTTVDGVSNTVAFRAGGVRVLEPGWTILYPQPKKRAEGKEAEEQELPAFEKGERGPHDPLVKEGVTKPPKHYTDSSLLSAMETCGRDVADDELRDVLKAKGIGTPATRAQIIETLIGREYVNRQRHLLAATDAGRYLIALVTNENLKSPELTGEWESKFRRVEEGDLSPDVFIDEIARYTADIIRGSGSQTVDPARYGPCPRCGKEVIQGKRGFGCSAWRDGCPFVLWREHEQTALTDEHVRELLQLGRLADPVVVPGPGGERSVLLQLAPDGTLEGVPVPPPRTGRSTKERRSRGGRGRRGTAGRRPAVRTQPDVEDGGDRGSAEPIGSCPVCGKPVVESPKAYGCSGWQEGCTFAIWKRVAGKRITTKMAETLLEKGQTSRLKGFKSRAGAAFEARLKVVGGDVKLDFA